MERQRLELKLTDTDQIKFKKPIMCSLTKTSDDSYSIWHEKLSLKANGRTPKECAEVFKDIFSELATELEYKSKYTSLSERERMKLEIVRSVCSI